MSNAEDIKQVRRLLARLVVLLALLIVLVAVGLYFQFVSEPSEKLREMLPVLLVVGVVVTVPTAGFAHSLHFSAKNVLLSVFVPPFSSTIGSMTSIVQLLTRFPGSAAKLKQIVSNGGNFSGAAHNIGWNLRYDPIAAQIVARGYVPWVLLSESTSRYYSPQAEDIERLRGSSRRWIDKHGNEPVGCVEFTPPRDERPIPLFDNSLPSVMTAFERG